MNEQLLAMALECNLLDSRDDLDHPAFAEITVSVEAFANLVAALEALVTSEAGLADIGDADAQPQPEPAPGYCKRCKDYTIEEPLFEQTKQQKRVWIEIAEQEMPEGLQSNWQFIAGIVWAQGKLKEKNA